MARYPMRAPPHQARLEELIAAADAAYVEALKQATLADLARQESRPAHS